LIPELEAISRAAWPARESVPYDGWLLTASGGAVRRNNAVHPISAGRLALEEKLARCEQFYGDRGQHTVFKLTDASEPAGLDAALGARGYRRSIATSVQMRSIADAAPNAAPDDEVWLAPGFDPVWLSECAAIWGVSEPNRGPLGSTFERIAAASEPCAFATLARDGRTAAQGLAVMREATVILGEIATAASWRRCGLARRIVASLLDWAREQGAHRAALQVVVDNRPALALYHQLGFREAYTYWYREAGPA
jgi:GNAT superfamily N-acetyltransferase